MPHPFAAFGALAINAGATRTDRFADIASVGAGDGIACQEFQANVDRNLSSNADEFTNRPGATRVIEQSRVATMTTTEALRYWGHDRHLALALQNQTTPANLAGTAYATNIVLSNVVDYFGTIAFQQLQVGSNRRIIQGQAVIPTQVELQFRQGQEARIVTSWLCNTGYDFDPAENGATELDAVTMPDADLPETVHWDHFRNANAGVYICPTDADPAFTSDHLIPLREFTLTIDTGVSDDVIASSGLQPTIRTSKPSITLSGTLLWDLAATYGASHVKWHQDKTLLKTKIALVGNSIAGGTTRNAMQFFAPSGYLTTGSARRTAQDSFEVPFNMEFLAPAVANAGSNAVAGLTTTDEPILTSNVDEQLRIILTNRQATSILPI